MERVFTYEQNRKTDKGRCFENSSINIYYYNDALSIDLTYNFTYIRPKDGVTSDNGLHRQVETEHNINLNLKNGDFYTFTTTTNRGFLGDTKSSQNKRIKNNFKQLSHITSIGFFGGSKKGSDGWGVRYLNNAEKAWEIVKDLVQPRIKNEYLRTKGYHKVEIDQLYDLIVDFHLNCKNIKGHDMIYLDIQEDYPKQKYLKLNERKFIPAVLDQYGIKNKQFVSWLSGGGDGMPIILKSLNYLCKLFGENYIDYMNKIDWHLHCYRVPPTNRTHELKNETEKRNMVKVIQNWEHEGLRTGSNLSMDGSLISSLYNLLELRDKVEKKGIELRFTPTNDSEIDHLYEEWESLRKYFQKGYRIRYDFPEEFIQYIEQPIKIGDVEYLPTILKTEEEFKIEGHIMKNCMGAQFPHGVASIYISLRNGKKWVDVQYRKGEKTMCYGKANSPTPDSFKSAINVLNNRIKKFKDVKWIKEKYDLIN